MFGKLRNNFIAGLLVILPAVLTLWLLRFIIVKLNRAMLEPIVGIFRSYLQYGIAIVAAKVAVFLIAILGIAMIGAATKNIILHRMFRVVEKLFLKLPMLGKIYAGIKEIGHAFLGKKQGFFNKVVLLEYPRAGLYSIGFITSEIGGEIQDKTKEEVVSVFIPTTPNPTSGVLLFVPKGSVTPLDMTVEEGLKLIISGGAIVPENKKASGGNS